MMPHNASVPVTDVASRLPGIATLRQRCRSLAMLDAIVSPEWESRYYSFNSRWAAGQELASMSNGSGDDYFIVFTADGAFIRGFDHESSMSPWREDPRELWPGLLDGLPGVFLPLVREPAFGYEGLLSATFCLWRLHSDDDDDDDDGGGWRTGPIDYTEADPRDVADPDGAERLLGILTDPTPESYLIHVEEYFEIELDEDAEDAVAHVFAGRPLTADLVRAINPDTDLASLADDVAEIGYAVYDRPDEP